MRYKEIALELGLTVSQVKTAEERALRKLRRSKPLQKIWKELEEQKYTYQEILEIFFG